MTGRVSRVVEYVDNSKRQLRLYQSTVTRKRTEQNMFVCIGKSNNEKTNNVLGVL